VTTLSTPEEADIIENYPVMTSETQISDESEESTFGPEY